MPLERENNLPERMTTLTSFSSLEISELEVKGLILSHPVDGKFLSLVSLSIGSAWESFYRASLLGT